MEVALKIRFDLTNYISLIQLASSLMPAGAGGGVMNPQVREGINATIEFINKAGKEETIIRGPLLLNSLEPILKASLGYFPLKKSLEEVGAAFRKIVKEDDKLFSNGIPLSWLDKYIDAGRILAGYTPYQSRIGIGYHSGNFALEETFLLNDGFYFLVSAEKGWRYLESLKGEATSSEKDGYVSVEFYDRASAVNYNVCSLARNCIVNLYSFIECFVNSVGYDYYLRNEDNLPTDQQDILKGKKGGFLSLEYKLEKFPLIINPKGKQSIFTLDAKQRRKPFIAFLSECKEVRDSAMHYSPLKESIWRRPHDWTKKAKGYSELVVEVAQIFWKACYSQQPLPAYLKALNYQKCYSEGERRYMSMLSVSKVS